MLTDHQKNWHYLIIKKMSRLTRGITSNHHGDFFCRNRMHSFRTNNTLKNHERLYLNHDQSELLMPKPKKNILEFKLKEKSLRIPHIIYEDLETIKTAIMST